MTSSSATTANSPPELMSESPGILPAEFWKGDTSISHDDSAGFQEERRVRSPSISQGINVAAASERVRRKW